MKIRLCCLEVGWGGWKEQWTGLKVGQFLRGGVEWIENKSSGLEELSGLEVGSNGLEVGCRGLKE